MSLLTHLLTSIAQNNKPLVCGSSNSLASCVRYASKKASGSTRIKPGHPRPKHRGLRVGDGQFVRSGTLLALQLRPNYHPGLHVGIGRNGTLYALESGTVMITCEKIDPNMDKNWVKKHYAGREGVIYKKHFNVIPEPQHDRFVLLENKVV